MPEELGGGGGYDAGSVFIGVEADTSPFFAELDAIATRANRIPTVRVDFDHVALAAGNRHIESKFAHVVDVNRRLAQQPITPRYDGSQVDRLTADLRAVQGQVLALQQQRIQLDAALNADSVKAQLDAIANQPRTIYYAAVVQMPDIQAISSQMTVTASVAGLGEAINPELKKAFKDAAKEARGGNILGAIGSVAAAPFKIAGGAISQAVGGAVFGLGQQLTNDFSKGLTASIGGKLSGSVGSPTLLGEKAGDLLANLTGVARDRIASKARQANSAIDKALSEGTLEFGKFTIELDRFKPQLNNFKRIKKELDEAVVLGIQDYYDALEDAFPTADRIAEAAAQRAKISQRRQSARVQAQPQIVNEGQVELRALATRQSAVNQFLSDSSSITKDERRALEAELNRIKQRRSEIIGTFKAVSTPELQRQGAETAIGRTQKNIASVNKQIEVNRLAESGILSDPTIENVQKLEAVQSSISSLTKQKAKLERTLERQQINLAKIPEQTTAAVQEIFDAILGATVPLEKLPKVIIDNARTIESNAFAFYSAFENIIVVNKAIGEQIKSGQLVGNELKALAEEVSHALQFEYGSSKGLEALATRRTPVTQPLRQVAVPTPAETVGLAKELQYYDPRVRIVELEAKVNRDRVSASIQERRKATALSNDFESVAGFGGATFGKDTTERINKAKQRAKEIQSIAQSSGVNISETLNEITTSISNLEKGIEDALKNLAIVSTQALPLTEIESVKSHYIEQIDALNKVDQLVREAIAEAKTKIEQSKSASQQKAESQIAPSQSAVTRQEGRQTVGDALEVVTSGLIVPAAKRAGDGLVAFAKAGYKAADGLELAAFSLLGPLGIALRQPLKTGIRAGVTNVGVPLAAFGAASSFPVVGSGIQAAQGLVSSGVGSLAGFGGARAGGAIASNLIKSFGLDQLATLGQNFSGTPIVGKLGQALSALPTEFAGKIVEATTGAFSTAGASIATAATTILGGNLIVDGAKKGLGSVAQSIQSNVPKLSLPASAQSLLDTPLPFNLPQRERVLEFAENAGSATRQVVDAASSVLEPIVNKVTETAQRIQAIDKNEAVQIAADLGKKTRMVADRTVETIEGTINAIELVTAKLPGGQKLADLGRVELEKIKRQLETKLEKASTAEAAGQPVLGGSSVIRGDIDRVQQVIEAKAEVVPTTPKITKTQYENDLKKIIQAESKQIEKLRSQLIENLRQGATSDALRIAEQLKSSSQSALGKLEAFQTNQGLDLEPAIRKSVNGYVSRFKDLIAQAENATAKVTNGEDFEALLSINTEQIAERFVGLINKLFEIEGKNLQDALGKAALSPRAKDIAIGGAGIAGGVAGRQLGIVSGIGGEVTGAVAMRGAVNVGEQAIAARNDLLQTETYQTATALEKLQQVITATAQRLKSPEVQAAIGKGLTGDIAGSSLGNLSATLGNLALPGAGTVTGAVGGIGGAGQIQAIRDLINARISKSSGGDGIGEEMILRNIDPLQASYSAAQVEILQQVERQLAEIQRLYQQIENGAKRVAAVESDIAQLEGRNRRNLRFDTVAQDRGQRAAALEVERLKSPQNELAQYLTRAPGSSGGGRGPRVPGPPTLFMPEAEPTVTAFDAAKRAAGGFLGVVDKIPAPIKNIFFLLGGGFVGVQFFQVLTSQANESFQAIKRLESQKVVVNFATGSLEPLVAAEKQAKTLGTNLVQSRESIKSLAIQAKNTPLELKVVPIFEGASTAAAALQLNPEQQGRLFTAFNQIAGKGTVQSEELRQQLGELGVSFQLAARAAGMTTTEFNKQLAAGAVLSQDFLPKFANQLKLELGGAALAAGDSLQGLENKVANAATKLQEGFGKESVPIATAGLKTFAGTLEFAGNNVSTLTNLINVALIGALVKGGQAFKSFAFDQNIAVGTNVSPTGRASRAGLAGRGIRDFVADGGIQRAANSPIAKDLANIGTQVVTISAGIGAFQTITEGFNGGERYQEFNRVLETTEKRIQAINAAERDRLALKNDKPGRTVDEVRGDILTTGAGAIGDLISLDLKGFFQKNARNVQQIYGGDPTTALSDGLLASQEQSDNRRILNSASDLLESKKFQEERNKAFSLATQLKNNQTVDPDALKSSRETVQSRIDLLKAVPEDLRKIRPEIDAEIKQLEKLQAALGGTGSAYSKLVKSAQEFENILSKQNALEKAVSGATVSRDRANGTVNEFDAKIAEVRAQSAESSKNKESIGNLIKASESFLGSQEFAALKAVDPEKAEAEVKRLLELKTQYAQADKQIDDLVTQNRLDAVNRRSELLQREITNQESFRAKLEAITRVNSSGAQLRISQRQANRTISPFQAQIEQSAIAQQESADKVAQLNQKLIDQRKGATQALKNLQQVNPNDEQAYQSAKAQYEGLRNSAIQTQAEINDARKQGFDAVAQANQAVEEQIRTQIDLTARKAEQGITAQQQATERLGNAQKRQIEDSVAGLQRQQKFLDLAAAAVDRAAKLSSKRSELNTAINQGAQIPLSGTIAAIRDAEGLIQRLKQKDLDSGVRGRTVGVLNQLGISGNEQDAFRYRISEEEKLARLKADGISAEIQQSQLTLDFEQRREEFASKRAVLAAQETVEAAKRSAIETEIERKKAENEVRRSQVGIAKATVQVGLAQQSGDPNKVKEAQLNLQDAQLTAAGAQDTLLGARQTEKLAKDALPNATLSVVDALANFAATIEGGKLSRRILDAQSQNKVAQFGQEERGRLRGLAIEGIDKGVSVDINNGGSAGFDPFGFKASRAKDAAINQADRQRFQNNIKGIPSGVFSGGVTVPRAPQPANINLGSDAMGSVDAVIKNISAAINFDPVKGKLEALENQLLRMVSLLGDANASLVTIATKKAPIPPPSKIVNQNFVQSGNGGLPI